MVNTETGSVDVAQVKRDTQVRYQGGVKSPILTEVKEERQGTRDRGRR